MTELNEDLRKFLSDCEKSYASRYTDDDSSFAEYCRVPQRGPPIEERWFVRQQRPFERNDRDRGRRDDNRRDFQRDSSHGRDRSHHRNRDREHGGGHHHQSHGHGRSDRGQHYHDRPRY